MNKKKLLIFIDWYYPAYKAGGPIKSVHNIVMALKDEFEVSIITSAYDLDDLEVLEGIKTNEWIQDKGYSLIYLDKLHQNKRFLKELVVENSPDIVYFNSLFSRTFTLTPLLLSKKLGIEKIILAPRGMLGKAALEIKPLKKRLFISIARSLGWFSHIYWHVSSALEEKEVKNVFGEQAQVHIAQNISTSLSRRKISGELLEGRTLKLLFYSRINSKKNLKFAIEVIKKVNSESVSLDIYGPIEDKDYWAECLDLIERANLSITYMGVINPKNLIAVLQQYHYLLFPTNHENYGHVITESLCASLPVIISQNTPWRDLEKSDVGFDLPLQIDLFQEKITELLHEEKYLYQNKVDAAYDYSRKYIVNESFLEQNRKLFQL